MTVQQVVDAYVHRMYIQGVISKQTYMEYLEVPDASDT